MLEAFGFGTALPPPDRPLFEKKVIMLGRPPHRIDLITTIDGVSFEEAWATRIEDELDGLRVSFIWRDLLLKNELAAGRDRDLADAKSWRRTKSAHGGTTDGLPRRGTDVLHRVSPRGRRSATIGA